MAALFQGFGLFGCFQPFHFLLILAVFLRGKHVHQPVKQVGIILKQVRHGQFGFDRGDFGVNRGDFIWQSIKPVLITETQAGRPVGFGFVGR